jgi:flagellar biosynthesis protein FlhF
MNIRTYQAVDMKMALSKVKTDLGQNAVILSTKTIKKGNGSFGMFARPLIEVTAALDEGISGKQEQHAGYERKNGNGNGRRSANLKRKYEENEKYRIDNAGSIMDAIDPILAEIAELKELIGANVDAGAIGRTELKRAMTLSDDIGNMKSMFGIMVEDSELQKGMNLETNYLLCYRTLIDRGMDAQYALRLVQKVKESVPGGREIDLATIKIEIMKEVEESVFVGDPITPVAAGPRVAALVGPTGVGKTTTIAKIAADLTLEGKRVGLITVDTFRIAAVEQLKIYAGILNIPLEVALTPDELATAISNFAAKDIILIDTAGRSQRDMEKLDELSMFLTSNDLIENYLVLSASADSAGLDETVRNFGTVPLTGLIFTKMDETLKPGVIVSQNFKTGLPVVYLTNGQKVPEDIEKATPGRLANALFCREV